MRSIIFCTSYMSDQRAWESRYKRWFNYYRKSALCADFIVAIDDASPFAPQCSDISVVDARTTLPADSPFCGVMRFPDRLGRASLTTYPGWWRSFLHSLNVARMVKADKIIHIESDAYILSERLMTFINEKETGWTCLWSPHFRLPETAIQIICSDQFHQLESFQNRAQEDLNGHFAEKILPFTSIEKSFIGDRYGEIRKNRGIFRSKKFHNIPPFNHGFFWVDIPKEADFATQVNERLWQSSQAIRDKVIPFSR
jgi:hypothetical protein